MLAFLVGPRTTGRGTTAKEIGSLHFTMSPRNDATTRRETDRLLADPENDAPMVPEGRRSSAMIAKMRRFRIVEGLLVLLLLALAAFGVFRTMKSDNRRVMSRVCTSRDCVITAFELLSSLNETADPCDDFYEYSTGGWRATHEIPDDTGLFGIGQFVTENNNKVLLRILESPVSDASLSQADRQSLSKLRDYYETCQNTRQQNKEGAEPLLHTLQDLYHVLHKAPKGQSLTAGLTWMHKNGFHVLVHTEVTGDPGKAPTTATPNLSPGQLGLPDASYYEDKDTLKLYRQLMMEAMDALRDVHTSSVDLSSKVVDDVLDFEKALAAIQPDAVWIADPINVYNPMSVKDVQSLVSAIDWTTYLDAMSPDVHPHKVIVASEKYMRKLNKLLSSTRDETLHAYMYWSVIRTAGVFLGPDVPLSQPARRLANYVTGVDLDTEENREAVCLESVTKSLGFMAGRFYAKETFGPDSKSQIEDMIEAIRKSFYRRLKKLAWLDAKTRENAKAKAEALKIKVGYPTNPDSTSATEIHDWYKDLRVSDSHYANEMAARQFQVRRMWEPMGGELNLGLIGDMMTAEVNAEYNADQNEIVFPAGLLQKPYFDPTWPMYLQYGALGTTAGHELSHAFDPSGRLFDSHGYLRDWWTKETSAKFEERQRCLEEQYGNYTWPDGDGGVVYVQSKMTIGEDVADAGGLAQSYGAWKHLLEKGGSETLRRNMLLPGLSEYTHEQLFFLAYGAAWARNIRQGEALKRIKTDPHSPTKYRVNGALVNFPPFAKAFGCKAGRDNMALKAADRCEIW